ncbi:hypothetical protein NDU88_005282 [Pleurodeles waltl]|uniref:Uncharacterized protein n=1 Tax=Pleurodeles waltl TaxID=8319 RepID=A0AAV7SL88_PLEWA|nr:hypothetical protein NDU88_005282 [Pleurodeles waltl]
MQFGAWRLGGFSALLAPERSWHVDGGQRPRFGARRLGGFIALLAPEWDLVPRSKALVLASVLAPQQGAAEKSSRKKLHGCNSGNSGDRAGR